MKKFGSVTGLLVLFSVAAISGAHGFLIYSICSLVLVLILLLSSLPLSRILFGDGAYSLIFAFPIGYILHSLLLSICGLLFKVNAITLIPYLVLVACSFFIRVKKQPERQQVWDARSTLWLLLWLLFTIAILALPLARIGAETSHGFAYRAYFNADFFKHLGITATLSHSGILPQNPYFSGETLHYYWFFYVIPAYWTKLFPSYPLELLMIQFTLIAGLMLVACLFAVIHHYTVDRRTLLYLFPLFAFGGSYEGIYALYLLHKRHLPLWAFTNWNIDALTRWFWHTPQVSTLFRALLYTPQHLTAICVFLMMPLLWKSSSSLLSRSILFILIFSTLGFGVLLGATFIVGSFLFLLYEMLSAPKQKWREVLIYGILGLGFLLLYFPLLQMFKLESGDLEFGIVTILLWQFPQFALLNWGAILIVGIAGVFRSSTGLPVRFFSGFCIVSLLLMNLVHESVGHSEVTLKLGYLVSVSLLVLASGFIDYVLRRFPRGPYWLIPSLGLLILPASVTWLMDEYNTQDIYNRRFTTYISRDDVEVFRFMRANLSSTAVVQDYSLEGRLLDVDQIPPFAERAVYLGDKFHASAFQVTQSELDQRTKVVWDLFHEQSAPKICAIARQAGIEYLFLGSEGTPLTDEMRPRLVEPYFSTLIQEGKALLARVNDVEMKRN